MYNRNSNFVGGVYILSSAILSSKGRASLLVFIIIAFAIHFAALQFGSLVLLGIFLAQLNVYRFVNISLRAFSRFNFL